MKTTRTPAIVLMLLYLGFLSYVAFSYGGLPNRIATHFDIHGQANGWMSRSSHLWFTLLLGFCFPLGFVGLFWIVRFLPGGLINIPRRDYWLLPHHRGELSAYLFRHSLWFGCIGVCFVAGIYIMTVQANVQGGAQLSMQRLVLLVSGFLAAPAVWIVAMFRHFWRAQ